MTIQFTTWFWQHTSACMYEICLNTLSVVSIDYSVFVFSYRFGLALLFLCRDCRVPVQLCAYCGLISGYLTSHSSRWLVCLSSVYRLNQSFRQYLFYRRCFNQCHHVINDHPAHRYETLESNMFQRYMFLIITHDWFSRFRVVHSIFCMVARSEYTGTAGSGSMRWSRGACPAGGRAPADTAPPSASSWRCSPGRGQGARPCTTHW